jgi:hypothetical protein
VTGSQGRFFGGGAPDAIATASTCGSWHSSRVSPAAANARIPTTCASCSRAPAAERSVTAVHRAGDEQPWWAAAGIDPVTVARQLWREIESNEGG